MSELVQAALIGGGIAAGVFASQLGRRDLSWHKVVYPLATAIASTVSLDAIWMAPV